MSTPILYVFAISHFCEKARWALDHQAIQYQLRHLAPGIHLGETKRLGAAGSSLPILVVEGRPVEGSGAILDWAETAAADPSKRLGPPEDLREACRALESRLDEGLGVHVRRYYYSEALVEHPETVKAFFVRHLSASDREALEAIWAPVREAMIAGLDLGRKPWEESRRIVLAELDWLDGRLGHGRPFLLGDRFSRADLTAASLLAPLVLPEEHPSYGAFEIPPRARADLTAWAERPALGWARELYRRHRRA